MNYSRTIDAKRVNRGEGYPTYQTKRSECRNRIPEGEAVALPVKFVAGQVAACLDAASRPEKQSFNPK